MHWENMTWQRYVPHIRASCCIFYVNYSSNTDYSSCTLTETKTKTFSMDVRNDFHYQDRDREQSVSKHLLSRFCSRSGSRSPSVWMSLCICVHALSNTEAETCTDTNGTVTFRNASLCLSQYQPPANLLCKQVITSQYLTPPNPQRYP